jgi:DNA polymerase-4
VELVRTVYPLPTGVRLLGVTVSSFEASGPPAQLEFGF